jgi:cytochrome c5
MNKVFAAVAVSLLAGCVAMSDATSAEKEPQKPAAGAEAAGGAGSTPSTADAVAVTTAKVSEDGVRSIELPAVAIDLPDAPGKNLIAANCMICHSPQYILMQPNLPRKTWEASVDKMRKTFGAPVPENLVPEIVDYLVAIRGVQEK